MMQATKLRARNQITLPAEVLKAAGVAHNDLIQWKAEGGEIRGTRLEPAEPDIIVHRPKLIHENGRLVFQVPFEVPPEAFLDAVREERERQ